MDRTANKLQDDVFTALGTDCIARVRVAALFQRLAPVIGFGVGVVLSVLTRDLSFFAVGAAGAGFGTFHLAESYLLKQDRRLFSTRGCPRESSLIAT
jgi:ethanolamine transporter EutH